MPKKHATAAVNALYFIVTVVDCLVIRPIDSYVPELILRATS